MLFLATCILGPGLAFGVAVAGPIYFLNFGTVGDWLWSLIRVTILHPATLFGLTMLAGSAVATSRIMPSPELLALVFVGGTFGYLLAISCAPFAESDRRTRRLSFLVMGAAFGLIAWGEQSFQSGIRSMPLPVVNLFRTASLFVTVHTAAAVCLSIRAWPELPKVAPPPLDDSATLPP